MAHTTLISIPMAKKFQRILVGQVGLLVEDAGEHFEGAPAAAGDVGVRWGGGEPVEMDLQHLGVLHQLEVRRAHGRLGLFPVETLARPGQLVNDAGRDQVICRHEKVLFRTEQAEQVGLGDSGPGGDGLRGRPGVTRAGELGDCRS